MKEVVSPTPGSHTAVEALEQHIRSNRNASTFYAVSVDFALRQAEEIDRLRAQSSERNANIVQVLPLPPQPETITTSSHDHDGKFGAAAYAWPTGAATPPPGVQEICRTQAEIGRDIKAALERNPDKSLPHVHNVFEDDDHMRGCEGRNYRCSCGYDAKVINRGAELEKKLAASSATRRTDYAATVEDDTPTESHARVVALARQLERQLEAEITRHRETGAALIEAQSRSTEDPGTLKLLTALVERAYGIFTASGVLRVAEQDPNSNDPIVAWASDVRSILYRNKPAAIDTALQGVRRSDGKADGR